MASLQVKRALQTSVLLLIRWFRVRPLAPHRTLSSVVTHVNCHDVSVHKVGAGLYRAEGPDGLPLEIALALEDGTPLMVAEQWWAASNAMLDWVGSNAGREC
jgi:hypothetical protein